MNFTIIQSVHRAHVHMCSQIVWNYKVTHKNEPFFVFYSNLYGSHLFVFTV